MIEELLRRPQGFNLFQAISLLERIAAGEGEQATPRALDAVRLHGQVSLAFAPSDVSEVARDAATGEAFSLTTPVLTLAGAGGPLPMAFTELLLERKARRDPAMGDFLDIFNHRFLSFLYRARSRAHVALSGVQAGGATLPQVLDAAHALGLASARAAAQASARALTDTVADACIDRESDAETPTPWLRHAALMGGASRSMVGLEALLRDRLGLRVEGAQMVGGWIDADPRTRLRVSGTASPCAAPRLGRPLVLGRRAWDQGAAIRLCFVALSTARLLALLPGGPDHRRTQWLVRRYLPQDMVVHLELRTAGAAQSGGSVLSARTPMRLGWTSWLTGPRYRGAVVPVRLRLAPVDAAAPAAPAHAFANALSSASAAQDEEGGSRVFVQAAGMGGLAHESKSRSAPAGAAFAP